jgi:cell division septation protein DedD
MSRSQRRIEKKQTILVLVLILVVAGVSFVLGVMVGQKGLALPGLGDAVVQEVRLPAATQVVPVPPPSEPAPVSEPAKLTFYDNLPKGDQAPLGSGINLPPEEKPAELPAKAEVVANPAAPKPAVVPAPIPQAATTASPQGAFVVQVASFRSKEDAQKLQTRLDKRGLSTFQERADLGQKGVWFRVLAGPYADRPDADQVVALLKSEERLSAMVRKR